MAINWFKSKQKRPEAPKAVPGAEPRAGTDSAEEIDVGRYDDVPEPVNTEAEIQGTREAAELSAQGTGGKGRFFSRLKKGLSKTRDFLNTDIEDLFRGGRRLDEKMLEEIEELLITADIGVQTSLALIERISKKGAGIKTADDLRRVMKDEIVSVISPFIYAPRGLDDRPHVVMVVGVNGVGKTTTIGKLAAHHAAEGRKVLIGAADTFRAAAIEQLSIWADRAGAQIVRHRDKADPAAVAFDAVDAAAARNVDVVLIDTAGRLHTKVNLMEELKKIKRSIGKRLPGAPHETLLVLDATTGQNAISQAKLFDEAIEVSGLVLTKLDGTAKGGIVVSVCSALQVPLQFVGVGEQLEDLQPFDPRRFVEALF